MTADSAGNGRVAIVVKKPVSTHSDVPDGFLFRYAHIVDSVSRADEVLLVYLRRPWDPTMVGALDEQAGFVLEEIQCPGPGTTRWSVRAGRLRAIAHDVLPRSARQSWEEVMRRRVTEWEAEVVIALLNSSPRDVVRLARHCPVIMFAEEDFSVLPTSDTRRSVRARIVAALERWVNRHYVRQLDADVVVISPTERQWAVRAFPKARVHVIPHFIDINYWQSPVSQVSVIKSDVFVIGAMDHARNTEGLVSILDELAKQYPEEALPFVSVASRYAPHPSLADCGYPRLRVLGAVDDCRPHYAGAAVTLVPSFIVTGAKTTVLQGWATRTAVVTTTAAARSVGGVHELDLLAASTPDGVARELMRLLGATDLRIALAAEAQSVALSRHAPEAAVSRLVAVIEDLRGCPRHTQSRQS